MAKYTLPLYSGTYHLFKSLLQVEAGIASVTEKPVCEIIGTKWLHYN